VNDYKSNAEIVNPYWRYLHCKECGEFLGTISLMEDTNLGYVDLSVECDECNEISQIRVESKDEFSQTF
jgi:RNase P subunit RPR2